MKKTALISRVFPPIVGGSGRWFYEIYRRLPQDRVLIFGGTHPDSREFDGSAGLQIHRVDFEMPDWGYWGLDAFRHYRHLFRHIGKIVAAFDTRAIHSGSLLPDAWVGHLVATRQGLPHWVYMHGEEMILAKSSRQLRWMGRRILSRAHGVIANSHNTQRLLTDYWGVDGDKVRVLHPGVDCARFVPSARNIDTRRRLGWGERPVVLTVGRLQSRKGQDMLIRALPAILRRVPNALYAIIGDGDYRSGLESLVRQLRLEEHVVFHSELEDRLMVEAYQQCDLFALPNREINGDIEGFGMVLLESQACGRPVVAGRSGGTSETMIEGETGFLLDCTSPDELETHVAILLLDKHRLDAMGAAGRRWVENRFDWGALAREAASVFS